MSEFFLRILNMSISASWIVLAVLLLRLPLKKAPKWITVLLWGIVAVRLICPFTARSVMSLIPSAEPVSLQIATDPAPQIHTGIAFFNNAVNPVIEGSLAPTPEASVNPLQILIPLISALWACGVAAMLLYTAISFFNLKRKIGTAVLLRDGIYQSEAISSPFVLGIFKPVIYLPFSILPRDAENVIAHERAHIQRKDHLIKPIGFLILSLHWFNPLMWLGYVLLCRDIELACDEKVIKGLTREERADYSQSLLTCSTHRRAVAACPLAFGEVSVKERVRSVLSYKKPAFWIIAAALLVCAVLAVCFLTDPPSDEVSVPGDRYYLLIGAEGVTSIEVSTPNSGGGCVNANGTSFEKGEKVWLEWLDGFTDLRGVTITAMGKNGTVLYGLSIPAGISQGEMVDLVSGDGWLLAPEGYLPSLSQTGGADAPETVVLSPVTVDLKEKFPEYFQLDASGGLAVYIWQMARDSYSCGLLPVKDGAPSKDEIWNLHKAPASLDEMRAIVDYYMTEKGVTKSQVEIRAVAMPHSSYAYTIDNQYRHRLHDLFWSHVPVEESPFTIPTIDTAVFDLDGDGVKEECSLMHGPTSGLFTFIFYAYEKGALEYYNVFQSPYTALFFEQTESGETVLFAIEGDTKHRITIGVKEGNIVLSGGEKDFSYWGTQGLSAPDAFSLLPKKYNDSPIQETSQSDSDWIRLPTKTDFPDAEKHRFYKTEIQSYTVENETVYGYAVYHRLFKHCLDCDEIVEATEHYPCQINNQLCQGGCLEGMKRTERY
ncbi:MAG: hypothetical protein IKJ74_06460 [Clostridia bacterium]|nr:hypothetical protein [Clostridia bacterium]